MGGAGGESVERGELGWVGGGVGTIQTISHSVILNYPLTSPQVGEAALSDAESRGQLLKVQLETLKSSMVSPAPPPPAPPPPPPPSPPQSPQSSPPSPNHHHYHHPQVPPDEGVSLDLTTAPSHIPDAKTKAYLSDLSDLGGWSVANDCTNLNAKLNGRLNRQFAAD